MIAITVWLLALVGAVCVVLTLTGRLVPRRMFDEERRRTETLRIDRDELLEVLRRVGPIEHEPPELPVIRVDRTPEPRRAHGRGRRVPPHDDLCGCPRCD